MRRILRYFRARRFERDLAAEMEAHLDEKIDALMAEGVRPEEARAQARGEFGNRTRLAQRCREQWALVLLDEVGQDLRHAVRVLRKSPVFTTVAVSSLALGIGANTIVFSGVEHVLLRSLPYPQPDRLFAVWSRSASHGAEPMHASAADFYDWRAQSSALESLAAYASWPMNLTNVDEPRRLETELVSANLFSTLGARAQIGRTFLPDEDQEQSPFVVVISHHLWRALGESPGIIGREVTLNGSQATVIGVMPAGFGFPSRETDAWAPLSLSAKNRSNREGRWLKVIGRLKANANQGDAAIEMEVITHRLAAAYPATNTGWSASLVPLEEELVGKTRPILLTLQAAALLLLLIACANLANLLLAKGVSRSREIAVRAALGAGRGRIVRQLIVESTVLATLGGGVGLALAIEGIALVRTFGEGLIPRAGEIHLSGPVALFVVAATLITALIFGLAPALHASHIDLRTHISTGARGTPRNVERKRGLLVAIEVGLASVLLVGAGLLGESLARLLSTAPGLRTDHVLTLQLTLSRSQYPTNTAQNAFFQQILERTESLPGIVAAGEISDTPLQGNNPTFEFAVEGVTRGPSDAPIQAGLRAISPSYLWTAGIPLLKGRDFTVDDRADTMPVAIINETMARRYWPGSDPVGRSLRVKEEQRWMVVAGVVPDIKHMGLKADEGPVVYIPYAQKTQDWLAWTTLLVRTSGEPMDFVPAIRSAIRDLDRNQPVGEIGTLEESLRRSTAMPRFTTSVIGVVSGFALLIALVGVYGLLAYTVAQRVPELGIRLALGASPLEVSWLLLRQTMLRVLTGVAAGLLSAWWLARGLESLLFGVGPHDPATFAGVAGILVLASLAAVLAPARRAVKIDPTRALRAE
ncbi:MAG: ABC transporter permease [Acidobacteriia bacterium]|nr:ABC transporter permease [Terriglobia bacterium]